jgi:hypothetical protein
MKNTWMFGILLVLAFGPVTSCRKKKDTIAKIYVRDVDNQLVSGASVSLNADGSCSNCTASGNFPMVSSTNSSGVAVFNFNEVYQLGQAGVAVLNIVASKDGNAGSGIIKVEQEVETEETVFI